MIYIHFCKKCEAVFMLNGHQLGCPRCDSSLFELKISFDDYINLLPAEREDLRSKLTNSDYLLKHKRHYRFAKHTMRYKERNAGL